MRWSLVLLLSGAFVTGLAGAGEKGKERKKAEKREAELSSLQFAIAQRGKLRRALRVASQHGYYLFADHG